MNGGDIQTIAAARYLAEKRSCFIGVGRPSTAAILARMVHNPDLVLVYESGTIGAKPHRIPLSIGDGELAETADFVVSVPEMFNYWIGAGRIQVAFLGAAQVDRNANLNSTVIGDYDHPKTRLPGAGGAPEIATGCEEVVVIAPHTRRTFVDELDFLTTTGARTTAVITDLGTLEPGADGELTLTHTHPGVEVTDVLAATGWDLRVASNLSVTPQATDVERGALEELTARGDAYVYDAIRTPFGRYGGGLSGVRPDDLAAHVVRAIVERGADPERIDEVAFGAANQAGEDNRNVARMAILLAGLPTSIPGTTINRLCGSSLDAAMQASRMVETGDASCVLVGGVESMSRAPGILPKQERPYAAGDQTLHSSTLGWRMVNPHMPPQWTISLGASTEKLAGIHGVRREAQDEFAARSHRLTAKAWDDGFYDDHVIPVDGAGLERDESTRPDTSMEKLAELRPAFVEGGSVTAGNSSPLNDGASALLIGDDSLPGDPLARIAGRGAHGVDPDIFGIGPVQAANKALERAGIGWGDVKAVELNEAFAAQSLACLNEWRDLDPELVNVHGGAIAIGHPLGASGGRILGTLAHHLARNGGGYGVAALCIGVGQGLAVVLHA